MNWIKEVENVIDPAPERQRLWARSYRPYLQSEKADPVAVNYRIEVTDERAQILTKFKPLQKTLSSNDYLPVLKNGESRREGTC